MVLDFNDIDFSDFNDDGVIVASAVPYATICTSLQTDNYASISSFNFTGCMLFLMPNSVKALKEVFQATVHAKMTVGTDKQCSEYCNAIW